MCLARGMISCCRYLCSVSTLLALCLPLTASITTGMVHSGRGSLREFCQWDTFNASCAHNEVVLMETARYGMMAVGHCVDKNYGHVGCHIDVLEYMDSMCSGRRHCKYTVPDDTLRETRPCPKEFSSHLETSYTCVKVETGGAQLCSTARYANTTSTTSGYLANIITAETGFGSDACPWIIRVDSGQRINITLYDFALDNPFPSRDNVIHNDVMTSQRTYCHKYAVIKETSPTTRETVVCGGEEREKNVYISAGNTLEVHIMRYSTPKKLAYFMLKYEAIGCPQLLPPREGWMDMEGGSVMFGCNATKKRWSLRCNGKSWIGQMYDCSPNSETAETMWTVLSDDWSSPFGILIVTAMGVALGLVIGVIMLASVLFCLKRRRSLCRGLASGRYPDGAADDDEDQGNYTPYIKRTAGHTIVTDQMELTTLNPPDPGYGAMWKSRPPNYSVQPSLPPLPPTVPEHMTSSAPDQHVQGQARSPPDLTSRCDPDVGAKLATTLNAMRMTEVRPCEGPKYIIRDAAFANSPCMPIRQQETAT